MKIKSLSAVALIAGSASCANAAVVSFVDVDIPIPTTYAGVSLNLETGVFENDLDGVAGEMLISFLEGSGSRMMLTKE